MSFQKDFDELLNNILTDYKNQFPEADTSQGSLIFIKSACLASALWGLYKHQDWISKQIFPDTADTEALEHHAWVRGLTRTYGETDAAYLARLLDYIRRPPAGGNKYDYVKMALEIDNVKAAYCFPLAQGLGTVDVVIVANEATTGSEVPSQALINEVKAHIDDVRPVTASIVRVLGPTIVTQDVTMTVTGSNVNKTQIASDITAYMKTLIPGQTLYKSKLIQIAMDNGADNATVTVPNADVMAASYEMIRPGVINVA
jgi:uncharacterized phage protein gp47/JayE